MNKQESRYGFLDKGGDIGRRIRSRDWSRHPLGPDEVQALARHKEAEEVFILDIGLPDIDGYGQAHDKVRARGTGFDHHFVKPVELTALCAVLDDNVSFNAAQAAAGAQALAPNDQ